MPEHQVLRHQRRGAPGVISLVGVKYTTARLAAAAAVDAAIHELQQRAGPSRSGTTLLPHAGISDAEGRLIEQARELGLSFEPDVAGHLTSWYGAEAADVVRHAAAAGGLGRLTPSSPVLEGEIGYAADHSGVERLSDVVLRRTALSAAGHPGTAAVERAAAILSARAGWTPERTREEIESVDRAFALAGRPAAATEA